MNALFTWVNVAALEEVNLPFTEVLLTHYCRKKVLLMEAGVGMSLHPVTIVKKNDGLPYISVRSRGLKSSQSRNLFQNFFPLTV